MNEQKTENQIQVFYIDKIQVEADKSTIIHNFSEENQEQQQYLFTKEVEIHKAFLLLIRPTIYENKNKKIISITVKALKLVGTQYLRIKKNKEFCLKQGIRYYLVIFIAFYAHTVPTLFNGFYTFYVSFHFRINNKGKHILLHNVWPVFFQHSSFISCGYIIFISFGIYRRRIKMMLAPLKKKLTLYSQQCQMVFKRYYEYKKHTHSIHIMWPQRHQVHHPP